MRKILLAAAALALLMALPASRSAQAQRSVSGTVSVAGTGTPLADVSVGVVGQLVGVRTNDRGEYHIRVPARGDVTLMVRAFGYKRQQQKLGPDQATVNFQLERDVLMLEGVTVTGAATTMEKRNATTAVAAVASEQLNEVPHASIENALQGKVLGANINMNNGTPGGGGQIQIRGASSLIGRIDPLFVLDGVIISNDIRSNSQRYITGSLNSGEENGTNRLADLNPNDIENIEVLKGSVASAIYGSMATNGVVVITTKRGRSGAPRMAFTQRFGSAQLIRNQGERHFKDLATLLASSQVDGNDDGMAAAQAVCTASGCPYHDYIAELYGRKALAFESDATLTGGVETTKYYVSGTDREEPGIAMNVGIRRQSFRGNVDQQLGGKVTISVGSSIMRSFSQRGISNNDNTNSSPMYGFAYTPSVLDLKKKDAQGNYPINPFGGSPLNISNPFQTFDQMRNNEDVYRIIGNVNVGIAAWSNANNDLRFTIMAGMDRSSSENNLFAPSYLQFEQPGTNNGTYPGAAIQGNGDALYNNASLNAVWEFTPTSHRFTARTSGGFQREARSHNDYTIIGRGLIPTVYSPTGMVNTVTAASRDEVRNQAYYAQEEFLTLDERLMLNAAVRGERSSVNGDPNRVYSFPRYGGSYRVPQFIPYIGEIKLRATVGEAGNQPNYGDRFLTLTNGGQIGGQTGLIQAATIGNPDIKPEHLKETEYGADFAFLNERAHLEATHYRRDITDLLVRPLLATSTGVNQEIINGGSMRTTGNEIGLTLVPIQEPLTWTMRTTWQQNYAKILKFTHGVLPFTIGAAGGFGTAYGRLKFSAGNSVSAIYGNKVRADGTVARDTVLGDANPRYLMGFGNDFKYGNWTVNTLIDYRRGGTVSNMTLNLFDEGNTTWDYDKPSPNSAVGSSLGAWRYNTWGGGKNTWVYLVDGSYAKVREITLSYDVPKKYLAKLSTANVNSLRINLSGRNLFIISPYNGFDPEVNNGGDVVARFVDLAPFPPSRSFWLSFDLGF